jgi:hypothetical protein
MGLPLWTLKYGGNEMSLSEKYSSLSSSQKEDFKRIVNRLLSIGFLTKRKEDNKRDYYFIENHRDIFSNYFSIAGWELEMDETFGVVHLVNTSNMNRHQFRLYESILLLIIRILYYEKMQELSLAENVIITTDEIHQRFAALKLRNKPIDKTTLKSAVRLFKKFNLLDPLDSDVSQGDARIIVYPTILLAVKVEDIRKIFDKLESYRKEGDEDEEPDQDEID